MSRVAGRRHRASGRPADRPLHLRSRLLAIASGLVFFLMARLMASFPSIAELYANGVAPVVVGTLSRLSGILPFALGEWILLGVVLREAFGAVRGLTQVLRRRRRLGNALAAGILRLGADVGILVTLFYVLWGFHYSRAPLEARLGWVDGGSPGPAEIATLAAEMIDAGNAAYLELHGTPDAGRPTSATGDASGLEPSIDDAWRRAPLELGLPGVADRDYGRTKRPLSSRALCYLGIEGYFSPFTGEPNLNAETRAVSLPLAMAHEKAHQRGFGPEDEANFMGYLVASSADHPLARYSAFVFAQQQLLRAIDPERRGELIERRLPGVRRDLRDEREFWARYRGPSLEVANRVNDLYLKSNRVEGGISSYGMSLRLLLHYAEQRGGSLVPTGVPE